MNVVMLLLLVALAFGAVAALQHYTNRDDTPRTDGFVPAPDSRRHAAG